MKDLDRISIVTGAILDGIVAVSMGYMTDREARVIPYMIGLSLGLSEDNIVAITEELVGSRWFRNVVDKATVLVRNNIDMFDAVAEQVELEDLQ